MRALLIPAVVLAAVALLTAQPQPIANDFVIRHVRVFDGRKIISDADVRIHDGKIQAVGKALKSPSSVRVFDGTGDTLLPGLIDAHTHSYVRTGLKQELIFGVTTELGMENDPAFVAEIKREQASGKAIDLADMRSSGWPATAPGGHGAEGGPVPTITGPEQAEQFVDARVKERSDYLKIIYEDGSEWNLHTPCITKETVAALVRAAHKAGMLAVAHIGNQQGVVDTINSGVEGLAHLFIDRPPDAGIGRLIANHHAFVIPTMTTLETASGASGASLANDPNLEPYLTLEAIRNLKSPSTLKPANPVSLDYALQTERQLLSEGVPILAGTDAPGTGTWFGVSIHRELELLVQGGMSPLQALQAATSVPASVFHLTDRGQIAKGKRADLLLVRGDPSRDIKDTRSIVAVWKLGVPVNRESFRAEIAKDKAQNEKLRHAQPPAGSESGLISNFEDGKPSTAFGAGWSVTTGESKKSTADMKVVDGGSNSSRYSLEVSGEIVSDVRYPIAGVMLSPGSHPFSPANLSAKKRLSFRVKGDGKTYQLMVFTHGGANSPAIQPFATSQEWQSVTFAFSNLGGSDGYDISAIMFVAGPEAGKFNFQLDDVKLE